MQINQSKLTSIKGQFLPREKHLSTIFIPENMEERDTNLPGQKQNLFHIIAYFNAHAWVAKRD